MKLLNIMKYYSIIIENLLAINLKKYLESKESFFLAKICKGTLEITKTTKQKSVLLCILLGKMVLLTLDLILKPLVLVKPSTNFEVLHMYGPCLLDE